MVPLVRVPRTLRRVLNPDEASRLGPAYAPGTPQAGGLSSRELLDTRSPG